MACGFRMASQLQAGYLLQWGIVVLVYGWAEKALLGIVTDGCQLQVFGVIVCWVLQKEKVYCCLWGISVVMFGIMISLVLQ